MPKSVVTDLFDVVKIDPKKVDNVIIDGMFFLQNLTVHLPQTLRGLVRHILVKALKMSEQKVDFVLDTYDSFCLKDITRDTRGDDVDDSDEFYSLCSGKKDTIQISKNKSANIFDRKVFFFFFDNECICLQCDEEGVLQVDDVDDLNDAHNEADTRLAFHAVHVKEFNPNNTIIGHNDTNILIMGLYYNNSSTFIDIKGTTDKLNLIQALLEYTNLLVAITLLHFSEKVKSVQLK